MTTPHSARLLLVLWVAAGSAVGSLAAVVAVGVAAGRQIVAPWMVNGTALVLVFLCVIAVAMIVSDQESSAGPVPVPVPPAGSPGDRPAPPNTDRSRGDHRASLPYGSQTRPGLADHGAADQSVSVQSPPPAAPENAAHTHFSLTGDSPAVTATGGLPWHEAAALGVAGEATASTSSAPVASRPPETLDAGARTAVPEQHEIPLTATAPEQAVRRIVQCPRCGSFGVRAERVRDGCTFECGDCGHPWYWRPGTPWPLTLIRPRLRRSDPGPSSNPPAVWHLPS